MSNHTANRALSKDLGAAVAQQDLERDASPGMGPNGKVKVFSTRSEN